MKYMGSKKWMLRNGLGDTLDRAARRASRFVDLFAGSGAVAAHIARKHAIPVYAYDLQKFSVVLSEAVLCRRAALDADKMWEAWKSRAQRIVARHKVPTTKRFTRTYVLRCRRWSSGKQSLPITRAYGGHYFSPEQALWIDALRRTLPVRKQEAAAALAALIQAASQCAASPGHTAQPFQPTRSAREFLREAWAKKMGERALIALKTLAESRALVGGRAKVLDAERAARLLRAGDLAFVDPPYSSVHYSRFYHVLETIAHGGCGDVSGVGRYPRQEKRPYSRFSVKSECARAFADLMRTIAGRKASAIVTFPDHECSNGLSGQLVRKIAKRFFRVRERTVVSKFSTLGGSEGKSKLGNGRAARMPASELILILSPRKRKKSDGRTHDSRVAQR